MKARLLIVEDERGLVITLRDRLGHEGYAVDTTADPSEAVAWASKWAFDAILLDLMLPRGRGLDVCSQLRARGIDTPVIILAARSTGLDEVSGLKLGAADCLTKPFEMADLLARLEVHIRRRSGEQVPATAQAGPMRIGRLEVDLPRAEVRRDGELVALSAKEFHLLRYFLEHPGATIGREELLDVVWGYDSVPNTRTVDVHVASLRRKLEVTPRTPSHIITVHGLGYKFIS